MKSSLGIIALFLLYQSVPVGAIDRPIFLNSIPKCGTHLVMKCFEEIAGQEAVFAGHGTTGNKMLQQFISLKPNHYLRAHLPFSGQDNDIINKINPAAFLVYRDPRDQIVSFAFWIQHEFAITKAGSHLVPLEQIITDLIEKSYIYEQKKWFNIHSIQEFYDRFLLWANNPRFCLIRFEHLVGPAGGGSFELQCQEIKKIANHLGIMLAEEQITTIANNLFGGTNTFREGHIGSWKKHFTAYHKQLFKKIGQQTLLALGYETDNAW